jgi:glucose dehydrogenase
MVWKIDHLNSANTSNAAPGGGKKKIPNNFSGGLISSPGIVWTSSANSLQAYDSHNGKLLWTSPPAKSATFSTPSTYSAGGKQYVTLLYGGTGDLYAYALP